MLRLVVVRLGREIYEGRLSAAQALALAQDPIRLAREFLVEEGVAENIGVAFSIARWRFFASTCKN